MVHISPHGWLQMQNTPGTRGGPGGHDRTLAVKSRKNSRISSFVKSYAKIWRISPSHALQTPQVLNSFQKHGPTLPKTIGAEHGHTQDQQQVFLLVQKFFGPQKIKSQKNILVWNIFAVSKSVKLL